MGEKNDHKREGIGNRVWSDVLFPKHLNLLQHPI